MIRRESVFKIGRFGKPHGVKGEISLAVTNGLFDKAEIPYIVCDIDGILVPFFIEGRRYKSSAVILLKLECVDTGEASGKFLNREVYCPRDAVDEEDGAGVSEETWESFLGYTVTDRTSGLSGQITAVDESTVNVLLQIDYPGGRLLAPAAGELITAIDYPNRQIIMSLPEGLPDI